MPALLRSLLAILAGIVVGALINGALITLGPSHFGIVFLAHALGTFFGALIAYLVAENHKARFAWAIGVIFLLGGIAASYLIPAPAWFIALDLIAAYLPMAWLAIRLGERKNKHP